MPHNEKKSADAQAKGTLDMQSDLIFVSAMITTLV